MGSLSRAHEIIEAAANAGATSVKFQTYTADTMTLDLPDFSVANEHELWGGRRLYELYKEAYTPWEWHSELFAHCHELGVIPFSSPFDPTAVDFLEKLNTQIYKIASLENGDYELLRAIARTGKPVIMSTGATEFVEIREAVEVLKLSGNTDLTLLVCTSSYPSDPKESHTRRISLLMNEFDCKIGISDHTLGIGASIGAIALGAVAVEKHLTLRRSDGGADGAFSMEPEEFKSLVENGNIAQASLGNGTWTIQPSETESRRLRRSLYITKNVKKGDSVTKSNVRAIRPSGGAHPRELDNFLGKIFISDFSVGTPMESQLVTEP